MVLTIILATLIFLAIVGAMMVGVLSGRKPITGSCGGLANAPFNAGERTCSLCGAKTQSDCGQQSS